MFDNQHRVLSNCIKVNMQIALTIRVDTIGLPANDDHDFTAGSTKMKTSKSAMFLAAFIAASIPAAASAGCYSCYAPPPPPCYTCYQQQIAPPQYRTVDETVMVAPGRVVTHRTPAQYQTVMVPQTVMVAPAGVEYEQIPAQYATQQRVEMVAPARSYYVAVPPRCGSCGY